jgi:hypothetical protein
MNPELTAHLIRKVLAGGRPAPGPTPGPAAAPAASPNPGPGPGLLSRRWGCAAGRCPKAGAGPGDRPPGRSYRSSACSARMRAAMVASLCVRCLFSSATVCLLSFSTWQGSGQARRAGNKEERRKKGVRRECVLGLHRYRDVPHIPRPTPTPISPAPAPRLPPPFTSAVSAARSLVQSRPLFASSILLQLHPARPAAQE